MEKDGHYFLVGVFVFTAFFALVGFSIWLQSPRDVAEYDRYTVYFTGSLSGLEQGSDVLYRGVKAGKVENLRLSPDNPEIIKADIAIHKAIPVRAETRVLLNSRGITGMFYLELATARGDKTPVRKIKGEKYPVLDGKGSPVTELLENMAEFSDGGFTQINAAVREIRRAAESFRKLVEQLREEPSQLLRRKKK